MANRRGLRFWLKLFEIKLKLLPLENDKKRHKKRYQWPQKHRCILSHLRKNDSHSFNSLAMALLKQIVFTSGISKEFLEMLILLNLCISNLRTGLRINARIRICTAPCIKIRVTFFINKVLNFVANYMLYSLSPTFEICYNQ